MSEMSENMSEMNEMNEREDRTYYVIAGFLGGTIAVELERTGDEPDIWRDIRAFDDYAKTSLADVLVEDDIFETVDDIDDVKYRIDHMVCVWDPFALLAVIEYPSEVRRLCESLPRICSSGVEFDHIAHGGQILSEDVEYAGLRYHIEYLLRDDDTYDFDTDDVDWYHDHAVRIEVYLVTRWDLWD